MITFLNLAISVIQPGAPTIFADIVLDSLLNRFQLRDQEGQMKL